MTTTRAPMIRLLLLLLVAAACCFSSGSVVAATDSIGLGASVTGNQTLVSAGGIFELGFFSPPGGRTYLGIRYAGIADRTVVWVANRNDPLVSAPGALRLAPDGRLLILDRQNSTVWSSPAPTRRITAGAVARLGDDGNFLLSSDGSGSPQSVAWQSFDYPTDTLLPGMKLGIDFKRRLTRNLTSWNTPNDPSPGQYTFKLVPGGLPEFFLFQGPKKIYASGPFNGAGLTGVPNLRSQDFLFTVVNSPDETYYSYAITNPQLRSRFLMDGTAGVVQRYVWTNGQWSSFWYYPTDPCDTYGKCGAFGYCDTTQAPLCACLPGFQPRSTEQWNLRDGTGGCVRTTNLSCGAGDGFWPVSQMKLPEATNATVHADMTLDQCRQACLADCSCRAYSAANVSGGINRGCVIWGVDLMDMRQYPAVVQDVFIRLAQSEVDALIAAARRQRPNRKLLIAGVAAASGVLLLGAILGCCCFWRKKRQAKTAPSSHSDVLPLRHRKHPAASPARNQRLEENRMGSEKDLDLPFFDLEAILTATDDFDPDSKIGQGGFGSVYMGKLEDGQEVAVKRLSKKSVQGVGEFKNEVKLIAKLQHRNLVKLLGCCIDDDERMLVYEFMPNNSLDTFIFDEEKRKSLVWKNRFEIIMGIARGLLYLHEDSRVRIIHRDMKASNVLLDRNMIPKISDFGIARMFGGDQTTEYTMKVIGTYGYMSPEYAMDGVFSMKSDIYSFGVLVIEIITGKRNRGFYDDELDLNLLGYAWMLWKEGRGVELLDEAMGGTFDYDVVLSENATMPEPNEPGVNIGKITSDTESSQTQTGISLTETAVDAR
ncbi:unnamed protein product [Triticum turgidum subsp. durum]|uniref:Receptor-like serine/threonine-protein kinase n=2 Tax=Triticum TaxID=4564 RepID=A0A9R0RQC5_TRITD|nr:unnamed protein product [Triticum turgidum subsp. durum]